MLLPLLFTRVTIAAKTQIHGHTTLNTMARACFARRLDMIAKVGQASQVVCSTGGMILIGAPASIAFLMALSFPGASSSNTSWWRMPPLQLFCRSCSVQLMQLMQCTGLGDVVLPDMLNAN